MKGKDEGVGFGRKVRMEDDEDGEHDYVHYQLQIGLDWNLVNWTQRYGSSTEISSTKVRIW